MSRFTNLKEGVYLCQLRVFSNTETIPWRSERRWWHSSQHVTGWSDCYSKILQKGSNQSERKSYKEKTGLLERSELLSAYPVFARSPPRDFHLKRGRPVKRITFSICGTGIIINVRVVENEDKWWVKAKQLRIKREGEYVCDITSP